MTKRAQRTHSPGFKTHDFDLNVHVLEASDGVCPRRIGGKMCAAAEHMPTLPEGSRSHPPSDLVASDWAGFPRWGGELGACLTERTGFYDPYAAFAYPGVDRVRTSRPFGFAAAGA